MITLEEYQKIDQMDTKLWNIGFITGFAEHLDFEDEGWTDREEDFLKGMDENNIRILHSETALREYPNLLPRDIDDSNNQLYFAFGGSADDFMESMIENSGIFEFAAEFIVYDMITKRFCTQSVDSGELDTGWVGYDKQEGVVFTEFENENEAFLDYLVGGLDMDEEDAKKELENITDKYHFYEKYGLNDDNHYKSEKLDNDLPDEFTLDNGKYKIHSNIKERIIFLRENGLEKFDEWIKKEGI